MIAASAASVVGLVALNASQKPTGSSTPNASCVQQIADSNTKSQTFLDSDFLGCEVKGMTEAAATDFIASKGSLWRIAARDGKSFILTQDYSEARINLTLNNNQVTDYFVG